MLRSIATICVNGTLRTKLRAIADAGFEHVEIFESDLLACPESVAVVGAIVHALEHDTVGGPLHATGNWRFATRSEPDTFDWSASSSPRPSCSWRSVVWPGS